MAMSLIPFGKSLFRLGSRFFRNLLAILSDASKPLFEVLLVRAAPTGSILHLVFGRSSGHNMMYYKYVIHPLGRPQDLWILTPV
ncbi:MAG TPA: hypothetical protein DEX36_10490 [Glutamicibacter sp.]|nr:hypothetical protein [Glutamicibacter sp.]